MIIKDLLNALGPCGLNCEKCFANKNGKIKEYSLKLKENLGEFDIFAERFVDLIHEPTFKKYSSFKEMLSYLSTVS